MKKRIFSFFLALCMLCTLLPATASAATTGTTSDGLEYRIWDDYVEITYYSGSAGKLTIPGNIAGKPVRVIGASAFRDGRNLTSITIPNTVTTLYEQAFMGNKWPLGSL